MLRGPKEVPNQEAEEMYSKHIKKTLAMWKFTEINSKNCHAVPECIYRSEISIGNISYITGDHEKAILKYEEEMIKVVSVYLRTYRDKFPDNKALNKYAVDIVQKKILTQETSQYSKTIEKTKKSWADFHVTEVIMMSH